MSEIRVPAWSVLGEDLRTAAFLPCNPMVFLWFGKRLSSLVSLLVRMLIISDQGPNLIASFSLIHFLRGPISEYSHTGRLELQHMNFDGTQTLSL